MTSLLCTAALSCQSDGKDQHEEDDEHGDGHGARDDGQLAETVRRRRCLPRALHVTTQ